MRKRVDTYLREAFARDPSLERGYEQACMEMQFAEALAAMREARNLTQRELAGLAGIPQSHLARLERGAQAPTLGTIWRLMGALNGTTHVGPAGCSIER